MTRTVLLTATVVLALVAACLATLLVASIKPAEAAFSGRNGDITFVQERNLASGSEQAIHRMRPDGTNTRRIYYAPTYNQEPTWSADGTQIAFEHEGPHPGHVKFDVWLMNADGSDAINLTKNDTVDSRWPAWFPSGRKIVFSSDRDAPGRSYYLYTISLDAAGHISRPPVRITSGDSASVNDAFPSVSPDGSKIAFAGTRNGEDDWEIYVMDADHPEGSDNQPVQLTDNATLGDQDPKWSPDGTDKKNLTTHHAYVNDQDPAFSPDGRYIVFASDRDGDWDIWRMRADGSRQAKLTRNTSHDYHPDWRPRP